MAERYTSYTTSLALREAGVAQGEGRWWKLFPDGTSAVRRGSKRDGPRALRLDEVVELLDAPELARDRDSASWRCVDYGNHHGVAATPVEAAAACLIEVLRAREVSK